MQKLKLVWALLRVLSPAPLKRFAYGNRLPVVDGRRIDVSAQAVSDLVELARASDDLPTLEESRAQLETMAAKFDPPCPDSVSKRDIELPGAAGLRQARIYTPKALDPAAKPTLLYLHGGGWVQGSINSHDGLCGNLAAEAGIRVVSFDYRLAPEHKFPAAPDDVLACYKALIANETELEITPARLVVGGDSAGANLTAALMHDLGKEGIERPKGQLLIYPAVDARMITQSMQSLKDQALLPAIRINWYLEQYLPEGFDRLNPRLSPLLSEYLDQQPDTFIIAGGHDPLWDDAHQYAASLREGGAKVDVKEFPGQIHAFLSLAKIIPEGNEARSACAKWLKSEIG